ncbi:MAG: Stp1/IreP family PP2C-type Ser/Thr phosphatase [Clostridia bacterium]|nr:Stp1/IreP family PP2C-type Ser/Thr phosphatase [Clostridia bacterium]
MRMGAYSDTGRVRKINEDSFFSYRNENLMGAMVADGMGGHAKGEVASKMATMLIKDHIIRMFDPDMDYVELGEMIRRAFIDANAQIYEYSRHKENSEGMGTTASMAFIFKGKLIVVHVGDSRVYTVKNGEIQQITTDHSLVQELLARGRITSDDAKNHPQKNVITRAIGTDASIKVDVRIVDYNDETVIVSSDGLTNLVSDTQIMEIINECDDLQAGVEELVALANKKGGMDNITCIAFDKREEKEI